MDEQMWQLFKEHLTKEYRMIFENLAGNFHVFLHGVKCYLYCDQLESEVLFICILFNGLMVDFEFTPYPAGHLWRESDILQEGNQERFIFKSSILNEVEAKEFAHPTPNKLMFLCPSLHNYRVL